MVRPSSTACHRRARRWFVGASVLLVAIQVVLIPVPRVDNHLLSSDAGYYYAYMRSALLDGDLDVRNDIELYNSRMSEENPNRLTVSYGFSVGPGLLWSPFFALSHGVVLLLRALGAPISADGFSYFEEAVVCVASALYAMLGLFLVYRWLLGLVPGWVALLAAFSVFAGSSALYYAVFEPSMSHTLELFSVGLFVWILLARPDTGLAGWLAVGTAAGLMTIVRWQNGVFLILLLLRFFRDWPGRGGRGVVAAVFARTGAAAIGFVPLVMLQIVFWRLTLGQYLTVPQGTHYLNVSAPHIVDVLLSTRHGLFLWTPITLLGMVGLLFVRDRKLAAFLLAAFALDLYISSVVLDWSGHASYGIRRLVGATPVFALGFAALVDRLTTAAARRVIAALTGLAILWNFAFIVQYRLGLIPTDDYLTARQIITEKFSLPRTMVQRLFR